MTFGIDEPILIWAFGEFVSIVEEAIEVYHRDVNPDVQFEVVTINESEVYEMLKNYPYDEGPNIVLVDDINIRKYLNAFAEKIRILDNDLDTSLIKDYKLSYISDVYGHIVGVPISSGTVALYYRKDIFKSVGVELTSDITLDMFMEIGQYIREHYDDKYLLPPADTFASYLMQSTGQLFYDGYGNVSIQYSRELFELIKTMSEYGYIANYQMGYDEIDSLLRNGNIVSMIGGPYIFTRIKNLVENTNEEQEWDIINLPHNYPFNYNVNTGDYSWLVMDKSGSDEDYMYVLDFLVRMFNTNDCVSQEFLHFVANEYSIVPAVNYMTGYLNDLDNKGCFEKNVIEFLDSLDYDAPAVIYDVYTKEMVNYLCQLSTEVETGKIYIDDAICAIELAVFEDYHEPIVEIKSIEIIKEPTKIEYYNNEFFDSEGMAIRVYLTDGSSFVKNDVYVTSILLKTGMTKVTLEYSYHSNKCSVEQKVTVKPRNLVNILVESKDRYYFHNTTLKKTDFTVTAIYDVGENFKPSDFDIYPTELKKCGCENITVTYREKEVSVSKCVKIEVRKVLRTISIIQKPTKILYKHGDKLELEGLKVEATYSNSETKEISYSRIESDVKYVSFEPGKLEKRITISYYTDGVTATTTFLVHKKIGVELENADIEQNFDESGSGIINLNTGLFHYFFNDFSNSNPTCSLALMRCYNPDSDYQSFIGFGWRFNYQQEIKKENDTWTLFTYEGKKYVFDKGYSDLNDRSEIRNEKLGLDLFVNNKKIVLVDRDNNSMLFEEISGIYRLTQLHNYPSTINDNRSSFMIEINYDGYGKITSIVGGAKIDGKRPTLAFIYNDQRLLGSIKYDETTICKYTYAGQHLAYIKKCNSNISNNFEAITSFSYGNEFSIFNHLKMDDSRKRYELRYSLDFKTKKVCSYSYGYGNSDRDITTISYFENNAGSLDSCDCYLSTILNYKNIFNVQSFSKNQVISNYSYKTDYSSPDTKKPKMILSDLSNGVDPIGISENYADKLTLVNNDFENGTEGWSNALITDIASVSKNKSLKSSGYNKGVFKNFTNIGGEETTCYISIWTMNASSLEVKVMDNENELLNKVFKFNLALKDIWQYYALPIGKIRNDYSIKVTVTGNSFYIDDFRILKAPYEIKSSFPEIEYNEFGNISIKKEYNPIDDTIYINEYYYTSNHKFDHSRQFNSNNKEEKMAYCVYDNGLLKVNKIYAKNNYFSCSYKEKYEYENDICLSVTSVDGIKTSTSYSRDSVTTELHGEEKSPNNKNTLKYYYGSDYLDYVEEDNIKNKFHYDDNGNISKVEICKNGESYATILNYKYDTFGNVSDVIVGQTPIISQKFDKKKKISTIFSNDTIINYSYDAEDRVEKVLENNEELFNIEYKDNTRSGIKINHKNGMHYDKTNLWEDSKLNQYQAFFDNYKSKIKVINYAVDSSKNESRVDIYLEDNLRYESIRSIRDKDGYLTELKREMHGPTSTSYKYDIMHRLEEKIVKYLHGYIVGCSFVKNYKYKKLKNGDLTNLVDSEILCIHKENMHEHAYKYEYYSNGNIAKILRDDIVECEYTYDSHNRIISEKNNPLCKYYTFEYDNSGNITSKKIYSIINGEIASNPFLTNEYDYITTKLDYGHNPLWKDQLKNYNGNIISYDKCGNPISYLGKSLKWKGRTVSSINFTRMEYDMNGLRVKKGNKIYYWYSGNLISEVWKENDIEKYIYYYYDENGVCGMHYSEATETEKPVYYDYYFEKNVLGDIVAIYSSNGNLMCRYIYDAWGNHKIISSNGSIISLKDKNIGNINPFRYRGYYWDTEFDLYYLKSRYYDPELGRFISPDAITFADPTSIIGYNLYAYCNDNPVMYSDGDGTFGVLTSVIIGAIIGFACSYIPDVVSNFKDGFDWSDFNTFEDNWVKYVGATLGGAIGGLGAGIGTTVLFGGVGNVVSGAFSGDITSLGDAILQFSLGALTSGIAYGISKVVSTKLASGKIAKIIGSSPKNSKINANLAKNGFGKMKVGKMGIKNLAKVLYKKLGYENLEDGISYVLNFGMELIF